MTVLVPIDARQPHARLRREWPDFGQRQTHDQRYAMLGFVLATLVLWFTAGLTLY